MAQLPVSAVVNVSLNMAPTAAATRDFGALLILGTSPVIDTRERIRTYNNIEGVASDFGISAPEYLAAQKYFAQSPRPAVVLIGRWPKTATAGLLHGKILTTAEQALSGFQAITAGTMAVTVDGTAKSLTAINLSAVTNLNGVASAITAKLSPAGTCVWDGGQKRFDIISATTGPASIVSYAADGALAALLGLQSSQAPAPVDGVAAENILATVQKAVDMTANWYGCTVADSTLGEADILATGQFIESLDQSRIFGVTSGDTNALASGSTTDIPFKLKQLGLARTFVQFSTTTPYAAASLFGRAFSVNFQGSNTTITLKFKQEPTVVAEQLTTSQAAALKAKNANVFVEYNNNTAIIQEGVMCNGAFIDERHGLDWLQNDIQTAIWNLQYTSGTKIPQTAGGMNRICAVMEARLDQAVRNGLLAPGVWNGNEFGALKAGEYLSKGYYVFANSIDDQSQADREARKAPPIQVAIKLAGAVHFVDVLVNVNR
jgi:hypothetical protein